MELTDQHSTNAIYELRTEWTNERWLYKQCYSMFVGYSNVHVFDVLCSMFTVVIFLCGGAQKTDDKMKAFYLFIWLQFQTNSSILNPYKCLLEKRKEKNFRFHLFIFSALCFSITLKQNFRTNVQRKGNSFIWFRPPSNFRFRTFSGFAIILKRIKIRLEILGPICGKWH